MNEDHSGAAPEFIEELVVELRSFFVTLHAFVRHPLTFSRAWASGEQRAMNPIGFAGTCIGLLLGAQAVAEHFRPADPDAEHARALAPLLSWLSDMLASQLPLAGMILVALVVHARLRRRSGQPFRASLGALLFAEGATSILQAIITLATFSAPLESGKQIYRALGVVSLVWMSFALAGVHQLRRWSQALGPLLLALLALSLATIALYAPLIRSMSQEAHARGSSKIAIGYLQLEIKDNLEDGGVGKGKSPP